MAWAYLSPCFFSSTVLGLRSNKLYSPKLHEPLCSSFFALLHNTSDVQGKSVSFFLFPFSPFAWVGLFMKTPVPAYSYFPPPIFMRATSLLSCFFFLARFFPLFSDPLVLIVIVMCLFIFRLFQTLKRLFLPRIHHAPKDSRLLFLP